MTVAGAQTSGTSCQPAGGTSLKIDAHTAATSVSAA